MTAAYKGILILTLIATFASAWLYLVNLRRDPAARAPGRYPEVTVDAPHWQLFNAHGEPEQQLQAIRLEQWTQHEPALLQEPRMELRDRQQRHWLLSAQTGRAFFAQGPIHLENNVILRSKDTSPTVSAETSRLLVARSGDHIATDAPVVLRTGNWHFSAIGLRADLGQERIELLEQVKGIHE